MSHLIDVVVANKALFASLAALVVASFGVAFRSGMTVVQKSERPQSEFVPATPTRR